MSNINLDSATWTTVGTSEDTLTAVLHGCTINHVGPVDFPTTDGIILHITDRNGRRRAIEVGIADGFLEDPDRFGGIPLEVRLSSPLGEKDG